MHSVIEPEAKLYDYLPVVNFIVLDVTSGLDDLKPVDVVQCLTSLGNCVLYRIFDAGSRGASQLNLFVDVIAHIHLEVSFAFKKAIKVPALKC
jgi:hypothetical protein